MSDGRGSSEMKRARCLIVLLGAMGDVLRGLVVPTALKESYPDLQVSWLVEPKWADLVREHPFVDEVLVFDRPRGLSAVRDLRRELRGKRFDITLDMQRHFKSGVFSFFSGAKRRIGFHRRNSKEGNWLFNTETIPFVSEVESKLVNYIEFAKALGASPEGSPKFGFESVDLSKLLGKHSSMALRGKAVTLVLGSSWPSKDWPEQGYSQLTEHLLQDSHFDVIYVGDPTQLALSERLTHAHGKERVFNLVGKTTVPELLGVLQGSRVAAGPDSGPGHMAAAVGTPYISLFGPTDPRRVAPHGGDDLVVRTQMGCMPCQRRQCPGLNNLCMRLISSRVVFEKLMEVSKQPS